MFASQAKFVVESPQYRPRMIPFRVNPAVDFIDTITFESTANSTQADFLLFKTDMGNIAYWIDIDADGTEPTAPEYLSSLNQAVVSISTGDTAAQVAAIFLAAFGSGTDNMDGSITLNIPGSTAGYELETFNADGSGPATSITVTNDQVGAPAFLDAGKFDGVVSEDNPNQYTITFSENFMRAPEVGVLPLTDNAVPKVIASSEFAVTVGLDLVTDGSSLAGSMSVLVLGSDSPDKILEEA